MTFIKNKEDFFCEQCGTKVTGTGYTNHCPQCLWSKHVDVDPGDRASNCGGMMSPDAIEVVGEESVIVHQCTKCKHVKRNKVAKGDDYATVIAVARQSAAQAPL